MIRTTPGVARVSVTATVLGLLFSAGCGGAGGDATSSSSTQALSGACAFSVTQNAYDGSEYWGTITIKNDGPSAATGYSVAFDIPSGAHCTNDAVPSGAKLSPLSGSGSSAATTSNHCVFTWSSAKLASGASTTFNYSTDSTSFSKASNVGATSPSCSSSSGGGSDAGAPADAGQSETGKTDSGSGGGTQTCGCNGQSGCAGLDRGLHHLVRVQRQLVHDREPARLRRHRLSRLRAEEAPGRHRRYGHLRRPHHRRCVRIQGWETAGGATLQPGTIIYNPEVEKYFIMEDSCLECGDEWKCHLSSDDTDDPKPPSGCKAGTYKHIDFWMGPDFQQNATNLNDCEDNSTFGNPYQGTGFVVIDPPPDLPVKTGPLYTGSGAGGGCWTSSQVNGDSCP